MTVQKRGLRLRPWLAPHLARMLRLSLASMALGQKLDHPSSMGSVRRLNLGSQGSHAPVRAQWRYAAPTFRLSAPKRWMDQQAKLWAEPERIRLTKPGRDMRRRESTPISGVQVRTQGVQDGEITGLQGRREMLLISLDRPLEA